MGSRGVSFQDIDLNKKQEGIRCEVANSVGKATWTRCGLTDDSRGFQLLRYFYLYLIFKIKIVKLNAKVIEFAKITGISFIIIP